MVQRSVRDRPVVAHQVGRRIEDLHLTWPERQRQSRRAVSAEVLGVVSDVHEESQMVLGCNILVELQTPLGLRVEDRAGSHTIVISDVCGRPGSGAQIRLDLLAELHDLPAERAETILWDDIVGKRVAYESRAV